MDTCPTLHHTSAEADTSEYRQDPKGLRVHKKTDGVHNQHATGCCLGAILLLDEVVVRELNEVATCVLLIIYRTCCRTAGSGKEKEK